MKYMTLDEGEIKELQILAKNKISFYPLLGVLFLIFFLYKFFEVFSSLGHVNKVMVLLPLILITALVGYTYLFSKRISMYLIDIHEKKKKIYFGILSSKQQKMAGKTMKYYLYMDGNKYSVDEKTFSEFEAGDFIEFHISLNSKYIFKVFKMPVEDPSFQLGNTECYSSKESEQKIYNMA